MLAKFLSKYKSTSNQVRASFWFMACTIIHRALTIITTPLFTRLLTTEEYGTYSVYNSWMGIVACFVTMNIYSGVYMQAVVKFEDKKKEYTSAMQGLSFTMSVVGLGIYLLLSKQVNAVSSLTTSQMISMFVVMWAQSVFGYWSAEQRVELQYKRMVLITVLQTLMQPLLCVAFIFIFPDKVDGVVWGMATTQVICFIGLFAKHLIVGKVFFSRKIWGYALSIAIPLIPHYISSVILNSADRIMIEKMVGKSEAGIYGVAYTVSSCGVLINQGVLQTLTPWIYKKIKENKAEEIKKTAYPALILIAIMNVFIMLLSPEIISIFAPDEFNDAIWVMPPIVMSIYFKFMYSLFSAFEFYHEETKYISFATMVGAIANVGLNLVFIRMFGYYAAGYTTLVCYIIFSMMHYYFMSKICKRKMNDVKVYKKSVLLGISALFLVIGFILMPTYKYPLIRYSIIVVILLIAIIRFKKIMEFVKKVMGKES